MTRLSSPYVLLFLVPAAGAACGKSSAPGGAPPAMPVEAVTLAMRPVEQTTEFVGTVKSRRSTTVQPQVEGFITRIMARSGDRVGAGAPLMEIDPRMQQQAEQFSTSPWKSTPEKSLSDTTSGGPGSPKLRSRRRLGKKRYKQRAGS